MLIAGALAGILQISEISAAAAYVLMGGIATCAGIIVAPRIFRKQENEQGLIENEPVPSFPELMNRLKQADELDELQEKEKVYAQLSRLIAKLIRDGRPSMLQNITIPPGKATLRVLETAYRVVDKFIDDNASVIESVISYQWDHGCQPTMKHYGGPYVEDELDLGNLRALSNQLDDRLKSIRLQVGKHHSFWKEN